MSTVVGIAGERRNAASAVCVDGQVAAVCEQERVTRIRRAGVPPGGLPAEAVDCVLRVARGRASDVETYAVAEAGIELPPDLPVARFDHHFAHAATAFWSSPFDDAVVLVCDRQGPRGMSLWTADGNGLSERPVPWDGPGLAAVYSETAEAFGFGADGNEHRIEALARLGGGACTCAAEALLEWKDGSLRVHAGYKARVADMVGSNGHVAPLMRQAEIAGGIQRHLGDLLLDTLRRVKADAGGRRLCLSGGLFYNTYFTTLVAESGIYEETFVPVNPGNAGVAVGAALAASRTRTRTAPLSPFLGPEYDPAEVKAVLDNCKLSYDYVNDEELIGHAVAALAKGQLVGWFQGRMEWGARALGHRSILASPASPYTLENLNLYLKKREPHRSYSVSVCEEDAPRYFDGPPSSPFMEFEYRVKAQDALRLLMPLNTTRLRVQTVGERPAPFRRLLKAFGSATGVPILVNTSFNGFHEPIVCTPRDAVRVFYGSGLDLAAIGNFILRK
jgi:carbamoyltransferase